MSNYRSSSSQDGSRSYRGGGSSGGYRGGGSGSGYQGKSRGRGSRGGYQGKSRGGGGGPRGRGRGGGGNYHWSSRVSSSDNYSADPRSRLNDDDIAMDGDDVGQGAPPRSRYNPYGQRPNRQYDRGGSRGSLAMDRSSRGAMDRLGYNSRGGGSNSNNSRRPGTNLSSSGWYQVTIPHGAKEDKDWLLRQLAEMCEMPFVPVNYHLQGNNVSFNVNDKQSADSLRQLSRRLTNKDGYKMIVLTRACNPPFSALDEATTEKLEVCMSRRYDPATKSLDLSNLYNDDEMKREGIQVAMSRHGVMVLIVKIIQENIPELQSLNLKENRLFKLDDLQPLATKAPNLSKLSLEKNELKHENLLHPIQSLQLDELCLDGNPLCDRFSDEKSYISAIRKRFPKVVKLDGHVLPAPIKFAIEETSGLPPSKGSHFPNAQVQSLVCKFLEQYFEIYDSDNRQPLLNAYHDQAVFSFNVGICKLVTGKSPNVSDYLPDSRNLKRISHDVRREKSMKMGRLNVVALLSSLPATKHDLGSFLVDVTLTSPTLLSFTVQGLFKERGSNNSGALRSFNRGFLTVPQGSGIVIANEVLSLRNATPEEQRNAFKTPAPTPSSSPVLPPAGVVATPPSASLPTSPVQGTPDSQKVEMVRQFSLQSTMNLEWSEKCLAQNSWDYNKSAQVFTDLHAQGKIPPEAFVK